MPSHSNPHTGRFLIAGILLMITILALGMADSARGAARGSVREQAAGTPTQTAVVGMFITVTTTEPQINVRAGPSSAVYPIVGALLTGSTAPAFGRSPGGDWIQIEYAGAPGGRGWVYSPLVTVSPGVLPIIEPPPTPLPPPTATIDPTLAAQFNLEPTATRLATFTPPPPLTVPAYVVDSADAGGSSLAMGTIVMALGGFGLIGLLLSLVLRR